MNGKNESDVGWGGGSLTIFPTPTVSFNIHNFLQHWYLQDTQCLKINKMSHFSNLALKSGWRKCKNEKMWQMQRTQKKNPKSGKTQKIAKITEKRETEKLRKTRNWDQKLRKKRENEKKNCRKTQNCKNCFAPILITNVARFTREMRLFVVFLTTVPSYGIDGCAG